LRHWLAERFVLPQNLTGATDAAGDRDQQRRDRGHQAVADRQHGVGLERLGGFHPLLQDPHIALFAETTPRR